MNRGHPAKLSLVIGLPKTIGHQDIEKVVTGSAMPKLIGSQLTVTLNSFDSPNQVQLLTSDHQSPTCFAFYGTPSPRASLIEDSKINY